MTKQRVLLIRDRFAVIKDWGMNSGQGNLIILNETGDIIFLKMQVYTLK